MADLQSYALNGVKESFANWISNISPTDTPFVSMTGKEAITNKYFQWQTDRLSAAGENAVAEGSDAVDGTLAPTTILKNVTQILRKVVHVSDTADALASYGRGQELAYQMEKAGAEIKRDLEHAFLTQGAAVDASAPGTPTANAGVRKTAGIPGLVATGTIKDEAGTDTSVRATTATSDTVTEEEIFDLTEALYRLGANPNTILFHPKHAKFFSSLAEKVDGTRQRMFDGETATTINTYVNTLVDPLGQEFKLIPNRFMPVDKIYIINPDDWTQMVLRAPSRTKLAKNGSSEKWMIEMEVGLRLRNDFAAGILEIKA